MSFKIDSEIYEMLTARTGQSGTWSDTDWSVWFDVTDKANGETNKYNSKTEGYTANLLYLKYRLAPKIIEMDFERCTSAGAWADDGQYLRCRTLKISKAAQAVVGDITKMSLVLTDQNGTVKKTVNLTTTQLNSALTSAGYTETKPTLFSGVVTELGLNYTVTLTLGDAYDQASFTDKVARSFARLHFSGAENGGVAVGMFSTSTKDAPKFEVADNHKSHFYGGIESIGTTTAQCTASQQAMGIQHGSIVAENIAANTEATKTITFSKPFAGTPNVIAWCGGRVSGMAYAFNETARATSITKTNFVVRFGNKNSAARSIEAHWIAVGPMGTSATADPELPEGPEIFDDDMPYADPGIARADYIGMMAGIEIPTDAGAAQADPGIIDGPGLDEPARSARFVLVERYYNAKVWNEQMVKAAVGRWITADEAEEILAKQKERE